MNKTFRYFELFNVLVRCTLMACLLALVTACSSAPKDELHSFDFDVRTTNKDIEVLDYRYGSKDAGHTHANAFSVANGRTPQQAGITGYMPRGDSLYVKWRIRATGEVREDTVDLRNRLPKNIESHTITFNFRDGNLFVYLSTPTVLPLGEQSDGPFIYRQYLTYTIYPDQYFNLKR